MGPSRRQGGDRRRIVMVCLGATAATTMLVSIVLMYHGLLAAHSTRGQRSRHTQRFAAETGSLTERASLPIVLGGSYEKPAPTVRRVGKTGATWAGAWRAPSEPGGLYMGGEALELERLPALVGVTAGAAAAEGYFVTQKGDSVSVDPLGYNCSALFGGGALPPEPYPVDYPAEHVLRNWPPDTIAVPPRHFASLCRFDFSDDAQRAAAFTLRDAELPFIVYNIPEADETARQWSTPDFLERRLGRKQYKCERSDDNHFMFFGGRAGGVRGWQPPTVDVHMRYAEWLESARRAYNTSVLDPHYYFRVSPPDMRPSDVPIFEPPARGEQSLFLVDAQASKGVHCRFGAAGIVAEAHYDGSRNMIAELGGPPEHLGHPNSGRRRYIMAAPRECGHAYLLPKKHPSHRHSDVDWSRPVDYERYPLFKQLRVFEMILEAGDVLYIPHFWIHYIMSLGTNFQCNSRSGRDRRGSEPIAKCDLL